MVVCEVGFVLLYVLVVEFVEFDVVISYFVWWLEENVFLENFFFVVF